jgi:hypothetical protein
MWPHHGRAIYIEFPSSGSLAGYTVDALPAGVDLDLGFASYKSEVIPITYQPFLPCSAPVKA